MRNGGDELGVLLFVFPLLEPWIKIELYKKKSKSPSSETKKSAGDVAVFCSDRRSGGDALIPSTIGPTPVAL